MITMSQNKRKNQNMHIADVAKALGHRSRIEIISQLARRDHCCAGDFCNCLKLAQSTISQHLDMLCECGLVERKVSGTKSIYSLNQKAFSNHSAAIAELAKEDCCSNKRNEN